MDTPTVRLSLALFVVVLLMCAVLVQGRRYLLLFLWPAVIYFLGPAITSVFAQAPVLGKYVFPDSIIPETVVMFAYCACFFVMDAFLDISSKMRAAFNGKTMLGLARSPAFLWIYTIVSLAAAVLQTKVLIDVGSIFSGVYILNSVEDGLIPYWGFLAGLYELIFLCFVIYLVSGEKSKVRIFVVAVYLITAGLRVAGGTRLILIKEIAVICILFYFRGGIKRRHLIAVAATILVMGSLVGLIRNNDADTGGFGPFYAIAMESGLDALTFNVAYQVQDSGYIAQHGQVLNNIGYILLTSIPSFLRPSISQAQLDAIGPYSAALGFGFETWAPVGGMSGFATISYISGYPLLATLALVVLISLLLKLVPPGPVFHIVILVFSINAIHFWRDPIDISVKNCVQDIICALAMLYLPAPKTAKVNEAAGAGAAS